MPISNCKARLEGQAPDGTVEASDGDVPWGEAPLAGDAVWPNPPVPADVACPPDVTCPTDVTSPPDVTCPEPPAACEPFVARPAADNACELTPAAGLSGSLTSI